MRTVTAHGLTSSPHERLVGIVSNSQLIPHELINVDHHVSDVHQKVCGVGSSSTATEPGE